MCNFAVNNFCFTDNYKQYHIHNDNDKIKPPDRYLFLNLMSKIVSLYQFAILPRFPDPKLCKSYPILSRFLSCPRRQFLLRWRVPRINNNNARYTRSSADADNALDAFVGQSRSTNISGPFQVK